jgi:hypothetical protein
MWEFWTIFPCFLFVHYACHASVHDVTTDVTSATFSGGQNRAERYSRRLAEMPSGVDELCDEFRGRRDGRHIHTYVQIYMYKLIMYMCVYAYWLWYVFSHISIYIRASRRQGLQLQCHCQRRGGSRASRQGRHWPQRLLRQGATDFQKSLP